MSRRGYYTSPQGPRPVVAPPTEEEGNVILCMVENMMYPITEETLETVVKTYGDVVQRVIYERPGVWQAVVQYATAASANSARQALEGHAIYEGGYNKLRVFSSSKQALSYVMAAIGMPEYKLPEHEASNLRAVVNGNDYVRAHSDVGKGALMALSGTPLPLSFVPTSIPPAGAPPPVATVPVATPNPQIYARPEPYVNGPMHPSMYVSPAMSSSYHPMQPHHASFQRTQETRYTHPVPMTTYQHHSVPQHSMQAQHQQGNRNSHSARE